MGADRPNQRKAQGAKTRDECLAAAIAVFARRGYQRTTMDEIAAAAGVTKGALYWHYRTKEDFLIAALTKLNTEWENEVVRAFQPGGQADDLLARTFERVVDLNLRSPWVNRFFLIVGLDAENIHPEVKQLMREMVAKNTTFFAALVEYGRQQGAFRRDVDASEAGPAIAAGYSGVLASWYLNSVAGDLRERMRAFVRLVLKGLRGRTGERRRERPPAARQHGRRARR
jgi:TetR/AcrR family acrAB operon transcriptional repressor